MSATRATMNVSAAGADAALRQYDFFVLQSSTAGGYALNQFLKAHPQLHLPEREVVDALFEQGQPARLAARCANPLLVPPWPHRYRLGFLLHSRVQLEARIPAEVAALCRDGASLLQLVRDPVAVISASAKRYVQINIFKQIARQLGLPGYEQDVPIRSHEQVYEWLKPRLFYFGQGQRFCGAFKQWLLIDATDLRAEAVERTMARLYAGLGVDASFRSPLFFKDFHGFLQRMFEFSRMQVNVYGQPIPVRLEQAANVAWVRDGYTRPLARTTCRLRTLGAGEAQDVELALLTTETAWAGLAPKLQTHLLQSQEMTATMERELLPGWLQLFEFARDFIEQHWDPQVPAGLRQRMKRELDEDYRGLFDLRPELAGIWNW